MNIGALLPSQGLSKIYDLLVLPVNFHCNDSTCGAAVSL